jgi:hypothetical protein
VGVGAGRGSGDGGTGLVVGVVDGLDVAVLANSVGVVFEDGDGATLPPQAASTQARMAAKIIRPRAIWGPQELSGLACEDTSCLLDVRVNTLSHEPSVRTVDSAPGIARPPAEPGVLIA